MNISHHFSPSLTMLLMLLKSTRLSQLCTFAYTISYAWNILSLFCLTSSHLSSHSVNILSPKGLALMPPAKIRLLLLQVLSNTCAPLYIAHQTFNHLCNVCPPYYEPHKGREPVCTVIILLVPSPPQELHNDFFPVIASFPAVPCDPTDSCYSFSAPGAS